MKLTSTQGIPGIWLPLVGTTPGLSSRVSLLVALAFAVSTSGLPGQDTTRARTPSAPPRLGVFLAEAARNNAEIPARLASYRARVETEMSLALLDSGSERTAQLEQIATDVRWRLAGGYDQRVIGYRSQMIGPMFSLMSIFGGWTTPMLYGNQLRLGVIGSSIDDSEPSTDDDRVRIHPLAADRDRYYRFDGGDTSVVLYSHGRRIPVVHIRVTPRTDAPGEAILFLGDLYLDAARMQVVRMRGRMIEVHGGKQTLRSGSRIPGVSGASFFDLVNVEINGEYWLPAYQRTEIQARIALFGGLRTLVRIVSRFHDYSLNDSSWVGADAPQGSDGRIALARSDSLTRFHAWLEPLGVASSEVQYGDFDDVAPGSWHTMDAATLGARPRRFGEIFRFNRIEGVFTGLAIQKKLPIATAHAADAGNVAAGSGATALTLRGSVGWAWAERAARGAIDAEVTRDAWTTGVRLERTLAHTNDFQLPLTWGATFPALFGSSDDFDYLDRRDATLFASRALGKQRTSTLHLEVGPASDNEVVPHVNRGLYVAGEGFRANRGIRSGNYFRTAASLDFNPQVSGMFVDRGVGARLSYERADGGLRWQRLELRAAARREFGPFQVYARGDAGTLLGAPAPQVMFEIGSGEGLSAYDYKEFGGDRAAIFRSQIGYTFPFLRSPVRLPDDLIAPGLAPGVAAGIHGAWTDVSSTAAERSLLQLGTMLDPMTGAVAPLSTSTAGVHASAEMLVTFFSGALSFGVTRPLDHRGPWTFTSKIGQGF